MNEITKQYIAVAALFTAGAIVAFSLAALIIEAL